MSRFGTHPDGGEGYADSLVNMAEYETAQVNNLADLDLALACARQIGDYLEKARATQDDGLEHEYLALSQHLVQTIIAALTSGAC